MENGILSRNLVVRILENRVRTLATPEINALIPCSNGDCYNLLRLGDQPIIECNHCGEITCKLCHNPYRGSCCNSFIVPDGLEIKPCPLCNSLCEREGGCAFITCPSCKGKFDIQTGKLWTKEYAKEERGGMHSSGAMSEDTIRKTKKRIKKMQKLNSLSEDSTQSGDDKEDPEL